MNFPSIRASWDEALDMAIDAADGIVFTGEANIDNAALASADYNVGMARVWPIRRSPVQPRW
ncbi:MAG: hypothetical protein WCE62_14545 [Polyangiales bacterium]